MKSCKFDQSTCRSVNRFLFSLNCYFYSLVNSYGYIGTFSYYLNYTFSWASLKKLTSTLCTCFACNQQQPFLNQRKEDNLHRTCYQLHYYHGTVRKSHITFTVARH